MPASRSVSRAANQQLHLLSATRVGVKQEFLAPAPVGDVTSARSSPPPRPENSLLFTRTCLRSRVVR
jgi:hypothetical protein